MLEWTRERLAEHLGAELPKRPSRLPMFVQVLAGSVGWVAAWFTLCWIGACFIQVEGMYLPFALGFTVLGVVLRRSSGLVPDLIGVAVGQLGLIASIVARLLFVVALWDLIEDFETVAMVMCGIEIVFLVLFPSSLQRFYSTFAAFSLLLIAFNGRGNAWIREALGALSAGGAVVLLWATPLVERQAIQLDPRPVPKLDTRLISNLVEPVGMGLAAWTLCLEGFRFMERSMFDWIGLIYGLLALVVIIALTVIHDLKLRSRVLAVAAGIGLVVLGRSVPGLPLAAAFVLIGLYRRNTVLYGLAVCFSYVYGGLFYYQITTSLAVKGAALLGGGALLLLLRRLAVVEPSAQKHDGPPVWIRLGAAFAMMVAIGVVVFKVGMAELHLRNGERVYLELAPVDPRSLVQGDYMTLAYTLDGKARDHGEGWVIGVLDSRRVVTSLEKDHWPQQGEIRLQVANTAWRTSPIATNAYLFQEGNAELFEAAEYGMFSYWNEQLVLVGLVDEHLKLLGEPRSRW